MELRKLSIVLLVFSAMLLGFIWYAQKLNKQRLTKETDSVSTQLFPRDVEVTKGEVKSTPPPKAPKLPSADARSSELKIYTDAPAHQKFATIGSLTDEDGFLFAPQSPVS